jgi:predicted RNA-binding Zn ribbon-like protein
MRTLIAAVLLLLSACERPQERYDAAQDIHAFLAAARAGDRATFDRHIDREALKVQLRGQVDKLLAAQPGLPAGAGDRLLDQLVDNFGPEMFQVATQGAGPLADRTPSAAEIAAILRPLTATRVCLPPKPGADGCAATFEDQGEVWRLVAVDAAGIRIGSGLPSASEFLERFPQR